MGVSFFEHMGGKLTDVMGVVHRLDFFLCCEATHLAQLLATGEVRVTGIVKAPSWATAAPLDGILRMTPFTRQRLDYSLSFRDDTDRLLCIEGSKRLSWLSIVRTMTQMPTELLHDGTRIASGIISFDLRDLPSFLASWSLGTSIRSQDLNHAPPAGFPAAVSTSTPDLALMTALAETLMPAGRNVPQGDRHTAERASETVAHYPKYLQQLHEVALTGLNKAAHLKHSRSFAQLTFDERRTLLEQLEHNTAARGLIAAVAAPLKTAHFARREYLDRIGMPQFENPVREPRPHWYSQVVVPEVLEEETQVDADVVVVGTGAGGGPVAALLAERGLAVAVIEEGHYEGRAEFSGEPAGRLERLWRDSGAAFALGNVPVGIPTGRLVGGSTAINSGTCFRTPDAILAEWRAAGFPSDFDPQPFGRWLDLVEQELQVAEGPRAWLGSIAEVVAKGAQQMGARHGPLRRNAPGCDGQGLCVFGCPTDARRSSNVSWIPRALTAGAQLFTGLPVSRVLMAGKQAVAVEARGTDSRGARRRLRVRARSIVVACGTLQSPLLLRASGIRLPWLGKNLSIHPALGMHVMFDREMDQPWRAVPQSYYVEGLVDPRVRFEGFYVPPSVSAPAIPTWGAELTRWMDAWPRVAQFGFMVRDRNVGRVLAGPGGRALVHYNVTPDVLDLWIRGTAALTELLLRGGAAEVLTGIAGLESVKKIADAQSILSMGLTPRHFTSMGFHPLGTCRMGASPTESVVDFDHRVHGTENLYVVDGSSVPSSLGVNPQITIMAMAARAAERIAESLRS